MPTHGYLPYQGWAIFICVKRNEYSSSLFKILGTCASFFLYKDILLYFNCKKINNIMK